MEDPVSQVVMLVGACVALVYALGWYVADAIPEWPMSDGDDV